MQIPTLKRPPRISVYWLSLTLSPVGYKCHHCHAGLRLTGEASHLPTSQAKYVK